MSARRSFVTLALVASMWGLAGAAHAQDDARANSLKPGAWALQFLIQDNFQLEGFGNTMFAIKKQTSTTGAWRLGASLALSTSDDEVTRGDSLFEARDGGLQSFSVSLHRLRYLNPGKDVNLFLGAGPVASLGHNSITYVLSPVGPNSEESTTNWSAGAHVLGGVEYFATRSIGVHAEYRSTLGYRSFSRKVEAPVGETFEEQSSSGWFFGNPGVWFGLSAYF